MVRPQAPFSEWCCYYCRETGHLRKFCIKLSADEAIDEAKEQEALGKILSGDDYGCQGLYTMGDLMKHLEKPLVNFEVGPLNEEVEFLVDTGAGKSCLSKLPEGMVIV